MSKDKDFKGMIKHIKYNNKESLGETFQDIINYIEHCEKQAEYYKKIVEDYNKDKEIQKLKNEIKELRNIERNKIVFELSEEEAKAVNAWMKQHIIEKHHGVEDSGAIGGRFTYKFIPTSIGEIGEIYCSCGDSFCFRELF